MGREKGHSRKLDSLSPPTRDRGAPEWGKEQRGRRKHEDISWFVRIAWSVLRRREREVSPCHSVHSLALPRRPSLRPSRKQLSS